MLRYNIIEKNRGVCGRGCATEDCSVVYHLKGRIVREAGF
jgi:hypothetical protein